MDSWSAICQRTTPPTFQLWTYLRVDILEEGDTGEGHWEKVVKEEEGLVGQDLEGSKKRKLAWLMQDALCQMSLVLLVAGREGGGAVRK